MSVNLVAFYLLNAVFIGLAVVLLVSLGWSEVVALMFIGAFLLTWALVFRHEESGVFDK